METMATRQHRPSHRRKRPKPRAHVRTCPQCGGPIPNSTYPGMGPGAISRTDNRTEICTDCGMAESMFEEFTAEDGIQ